MKNNMTLNGLENLNKTDLRGMSRNNVLRLLEVLGEWKTDDEKDTVYRTNIERMSSESGSPTVTEFLIRLGYVPNPSVKKTRTKITDDVRQNVITDIKSGVSTKDISSKYGITEDSVYNIKGKAGLVNKRTQKVPSTSVTDPTPTVSDSDKSQSPLAA